MNYINDPSSLDLIESNGDISTSGRLAVNIHRHQYSIINENKKAYKTKCAFVLIILFQFNLLIQGFYSLSVDILSTLYK